MARPVWEKEIDDQIANGTLPMNNRPPWEEEIDAELASKLPPIPTNDAERAQEYLRKTADTAPVNIPLDIKNDNPLVTIGKLEQMIRGGVERQTLEVPETLYEHYKMLTDPTYLPKQSTWVSRNISPQVTTEYGKSVPAKEGFEKAKDPNYYATGEFAKDASNVFGSMLPSYAATLFGGPLGMAAGAAYEPIQNAQQTGQQAFAMGKTPEQAKGAMQAYWATQGWLDFGVNLGTMGLLTGKLTAPFAAPAGKVIGSVLPKTLKPFATGLYQTLLGAAGESAQEVGQTRAQEEVLNPETAYPKTNSVLDIAKFLGHRINPIPESPQQQEAAFLTFLTSLPLGAAGAGMSHNIRTNMTANMQQNPNLVTEMHTMNELTSMPIPEMQQYVANTKVDDYNPAEIRSIVERNFNTLSPELQSELIDKGIGRQEKGFHDFTSDTQQVAFNMGNHYNMLTPEQQQQVLGTLNQGLTPDIIVTPENLRTKIKQMTQAGEVHPNIDMAIDHMNQLMQENIANEQNVASGDEAAVHAAKYYRQIKGETTPESLALKTFGDAINMRESDSAIVAHKFTPNQELSNNLAATLPVFLEQRFKNPNDIRGITREHAIVDLIHKNQLNSKDISYGLQLARENPQFEPLAKEAIKLYAISQQKAMSPYLIGRSQGMEHFLTGAANVFAENAIRVNSQHGEGHTLQWHLDATPASMKAITAMKEKANTLGLFQGLKAKPVDEMLAGGHLATAYMYLYDGATLNTIQHEFNHGLMDLLPEKVKARFFLRFARAMSLPENALTWENLMAASGSNKENLKTGMKLYHKFGDKILSKDTWNNLGRDEVTGEIDPKKREEERNAIGSLAAEGFAEFKTAQQRIGNPTLEDPFTDVFSTWLEEASKQQEGSFDKSVYNILKKTDNYTLPVNRIGESSGFERFKNASEAQERKNEKTGEWESKQFRTNANIKSALSQMPNLSKVSDDIVDSQGRINLRAKDENGKPLSKEHVRAIFDYMQKVYGVQKGEFIDRYVPYAKSVAENMLKGMEIKYDTQMRSLLGTLRIRDSKGAFSIPAESQFNSKIVDPNQDFERFSSIDEPIVINQLNNDPDVKNIYRYEKNILSGIPNEEGKSNVFEYFVEHQDESMQPIEVKPHVIFGKDSDSKWNRSIETKNLENLKSKIDTMSIDKNNDVKSNPSNWIIGNIQGDNPILKTFFGDISPMVAQQINSGVFNNPLVIKLLDPKVEIKPFELRLAQHNESDQATIAKNLLDSGILINESPKLVEPLRSNRINILIRKALDSSDNAIDVVNDFNKTGKFNLGLSHTLLTQQRESGIIEGVKPLSQTYNDENVIASVVGARPGEFEGNSAFKPIEGREPDVAKLGDAVHQILKSKEFSAITRKILGSGVQVHPIYGSWHGVPEPSFVIQGKSVSVAQMNELSKVLGFALGQEAVVVSQPSHGVGDGFNTALIGSIEKMTPEQFNSMNTIAAREGLDYSTTKDGKGVKLIHFPWSGLTDEQFAEKVRMIADGANLTERGFYPTRSDLNEARDYLARENEGTGRQVWFQGIGGEPSDIFRRSVYHVLVPFARAAEKSGYQFNAEQFTKQFGLDEQQSKIVKDASKLLDGGSVFSTSKALMQSRERNPILFGKTAPTQTPEFKKWFKEGYYQDENVPEVVYHQTGEDHAKGIAKSGFDVTRIGSRMFDGLMPDGVFMKPSKVSIPVGPDNQEEVQIPLYTNIKNPFVVKDREAMAKYLKQDKVYVELDKKGDKIVKDFDKVHDPFVRQVEKQIAEAPDRRTAQKIKDEASVAEEMMTKHAQLMFAKSNEEMRQYITNKLISEGYDGFEMERDGNGRGLFVHTIIAFKPTQVKSIYNAGTWDETKPQLQLQQRPHDRQNLKPTSPRMIDVENLVFTPQAQLYTVNQHNIENMRKAGWKETRAQDGSITFTRPNPLGVQNRTLTVNSVLSVTKERPVNWKTRINDTYNSLLSNWVDDLNALHELGKLSKEGQTPERQKALAGMFDEVYKKAWMTRGFASKVYAMLHFDTNMDLHDGKGQTTVKSLTSILKGLKETEFDALDNYLVAKHKIENKGDPFPTPMSTPEAKAMVDNAPANIVQAGEQLRKLQMMLMRNLVDAQIVSEDSYKYFIEKHPYYVPMMKDFGDDYFNMLVQHVNNKSFVNLPNPIQKIKGSVDPIISPLESIVKHMYQFTNYAERNQVGLKFLDVARQPEMEGLAVPTDTKIQNSIGVWENGEKKYYVVSNDVRIALEKMSGQQSDLVLSLLQKPAAMLRKGATISPNFGIVNFLRDQLSAYLYSHHGYIPIYDGLRMLSHISKEDSLYQEYYRSGAGFADIYSLDKNFFQRDMRELMGGDKITKMMTLDPRSWIRAAFTLLEKFGQTMETSSRLAEFELAKKGYTGIANRLFSEERHPETNDEAALSSRDVTVDFNRAGIVGREWNRYISFFNPAIQGSNKMVREMKARPADMLFRTAMIAAFSAMVFMGHKDDKEYDEIPQYQKDAFWIFKVGNQWLRFPKPFEFGVLFGSGTERFLKWQMKHDPKAFDGFAKSVIGAFSPNFMLTAIQPILEVAANYSWFRERNIVPQSEQTKAPYLQYGQGTSEMAKSVGKLLNVSPRIVDHLVQGYFATAGKQVTNVMDVGVRKVKGENPPEKKWSETAPLISALTVNPLNSPESIQRLYDRQGELRALKSEVDAKQKPRNSYSSAEYDRVNQAVRDLSEISQRTKKIHDNTNLSAQEKRVKLDELKQREINIARRALHK